MDIKVTKTVSVDFDFELHDIVNLIRQNTAPLDHIYILNAAAEQIEQSDIDQIVAAGFGNKETFNKMAERLRWVAAMLKIAASDKPEKNNV